MRAPEPETASGSGVFEAFWDHLRPVRRPTRHGPPLRSSAGRHEGHLNEDLIKIELGAMSRGDSEAFGGRFRHQRRRFAPVKRRFGDGCHSLCPKRLRL